MIDNNFIIKSTDIVIFIINCNVKLTYIFIYDEQKLTYFMGVLPIFDAINKRIANKCSEAIGLDQRIKMKEYGK